MTFDKKEIAWWNLRLRDNFFNKAMLNGSGVVKDFFEILSVESAFMDIVNSLYMKDRYKISFDMKMNFNVLNFHNSYQGGLWSFYFCYWQFVLIHYFV